jgi:hypothetical protein
VSTLARDTVLAKLYRTPVDPGAFYYTRCADSAVLRLEKRLLKLNPHSMTPDDLRTFRALQLVQRQGHVLMIRVLRYRDERDQPHETKSYMAIPPDYTLREVARPPGYGPRRLSRSTQVNAAEDGDDDASDEQPISDAPASPEPEPTDADSPEGESHESGPVEAAGPA